MTSDRKPMTLHRLRAMHAAGQKIAMLTCYDASFARLLRQLGLPEGAVVAADTEPAGVA